MGAFFQSIIKHASMVKGAKAHAFGGDDKRPRQTGSFGGSGSRGAGQFSRPSQPYSNSPVHSTLPAFSSELLRQRAPESLFSRPVGRAASSGSSASVFQHSTPLTCYSCGEVGHVSRRCPRPRQDHQPPRTHVSSGGRGGTSQRGDAQSGRGTSHGSRGKSQPARSGTQSARGLSQTGHRGAYYFSFLGRPEAEASDAVIGNETRVKEEESPQKEKDKDFHKKVKSTVQFSSNGNRKFFKNKSAGPAPSTTSAPVPKFRNDKKQIFRPSSSYSQASVSQSAYTIPACSKCSKRHLGEYRMGTDACYRYGLKGYI
ncbi:uncharacterized protein LOC132644160 [Lycium barbarum]|uniref:uncharacterized protein LOC132644160 n=1 Tax=Lycium barbarum TaxID=112863 RepID=UPI00293E3CED|nr:uncharacterized protein LOC132644160 [Lycium barbarum]